MDWEKAGVTFASENDMMAGNGTGDLKLHSDITRAQFCVRLKRYHDKKKDLA